MNDICIPEHQWREFCEDFTRQHHGWLVGMRQFQTRAVSGDGMPAGEAVFSGKRPLQELRAGSAGNIAELMVTVGNGADETSFLTEDAVALYDRMRGDTRQGIRVDSDNGMTTLIEVRVTAGG